MPYHQNLHKPPPKNPKEALKNRPNRLRTGTGRDEEVFLLNQTDSSSSASSLSSSLVPPPPPPPLLDVPRSVGGEAAVVVDIRDEVSRMELSDFFPLLANQFRMFVRAGGPPVHP